MKMYEKPIKMRKNIIVDAAVNSINLLNSTSDTCHLRNYCSKLFINFRWEIGNKTSTMKKAALAKAWAVCLCLYGGEK